MLCPLGVSYKSPKNGKERKLVNAWRLLFKLDFVRVPNRNYLHRNLVRGNDIDGEDESMIDAPD